MNEEIITKLSKDLKQCIGEMTRTEARYLVDAYYQSQDNRMRYDHQIRASGDEPHKVLQWFAGNTGGLEAQIASALKSYAESQPMGKWAMQVTGIGPIVAAGLLAHIDIEQAPTVGHIWRFAGQDPTCEWHGKAGAKKIIESLELKTKIAEADIERAAAAINTRGELLRKRMQDKDGKYTLTKTALERAVAKCPWNAALKTLCWKIGESFVKVSNKPDDVYGKIYNARKVYEQAKNEAGDYKDQAVRMLERKPDHAQKDVYRTGKLPDGHIHSRCKKYATKQFIADWFMEAYRQHYHKEPPLPYPNAILGHAHVRKAA